MVGYGVDAGHETAAPHRAREQVPRATRQVVVAKFLDRVPPVRAVGRSSRSGRDRTSACADVIGPVLAPKLHSGHGPVERRVGLLEETATASAHRHVLDASRAAHVRLHAQPVRRQRLRTTSKAPNQLFNLRTQVFHNNIMF